MRCTFLEKSCTKCGGENSSRSFFKKMKLSVSLYQQSEVLHSLCLLYSQVEDYQNILKLAFITYKAFLNSRKRFGTSLSDSFSTWFLKKKYFSYYALLLTDKISLSGCLYIEILGNTYMYCNCLFSSLWRHKFWN